MDLWTLCCVDDGVVWVWCVPVGVEDLLADCVDDE